MKSDLTKKAVDMLLSGATLLSEPCPYCKGVRVMKDGNALCVNCGSEPTQTKIESRSSAPTSANLQKLERKLSELTDELANETSNEKQQTILKSINSLIEIIQKLKK
tara:strand:- start:277 stop:597 length:321 start_codon:yes stop_codon:yes gene_type:complete